MSARQELAQRLANFITTNRLTVPYGGDVVKSGRRYTILFSDVGGGTGVLDGAVNVYGPTFIQISYVTQYRALPHRANPVFTSEADALNFLNQAFVLRNFDAALAIPTKA